MSDEETNGAAPDGEVRRPAPLPRAKPFGWTRHPIGTLCLIVSASGFAGVALLALLVGVFVSNGPPGEWLAPAAVCVLLLLGASGHALMGLGLLWNQKRPVIAGLLLFALPAVAPWILSWILSS